MAKMGNLLSKPTDFWQAVLALVTLFLGFATWRMAKATRAMLNKADQEVTLAQEQVSIASQQVDLSQENQIASRQPIIVPAVPSDVNVRRSYRDFFGGHSVSHDNPVGSSFYFFNESGNHISVCIALRNVGPGVALLPLDNRLPTITSVMRGVSTGTGLPKQSTVASNDVFEVIFELPVRMEVPTSTASWASGVSPDLEFHIWYSDLTGNVLSETRVLYSDLQGGRLGAIKTEIIPTEQDH